MNQSSLTDTAQKSGEEASETKVTSPGMALVPGANQEGPAEFSSGAVRETDIKWVLAARTRPDLCYCTSAKSALPTVFMAFGAACKDSSTRHPLPLLF